MDFWLFFRNRTFISLCAEVLLFLKIIKTIDCCPWRLEQKSWKLFQETVVALLKLPASKVIPLRGRVTSLRCKSLAYLFWNSVALYYGGAFSSLVQATSTCNSSNQNLLSKALVKGAVKYLFSFGFINIGIELSLSGTYLSPEIILTENNFFPLSTQ